MARQRKGTARRGRLAKREVKRVWSALELASEITIPRPAMTEQKPVAEVTPP